MSRTPFLVAGRRIDPALNRLSYGDEVTQLEPKIMAVLLCLADSAGEVQSRESLLERVWPDVYVSEDVLNRSIAELRRIFDDDPKAPQVIDTIRKRGYRLIAAVEELEAEPSGPSSSSREAGRFRRRQWVTAATLILVSAAAIVAWRLSDDGAGGAVFADRTSSAAPLRLTPLTSAPGQERDPAVSPDGTRVAYVVIDEDARTSHVFVQLRENQARDQLTEGRVRDRYPTWSPDGTQLVFVREDDERCDFMLTNVIGGHERRLTECDLPRHMDWSPDGHTLVAPRRISPGQLGLATLDLETLEWDRLSTPPAPFRADHEPRFSPDGRHVAFTRSLDGTISDLWVLDTLTGGERRLTFDHRDVVGQAWSPDGESLVFSSDRAGNYGLWRVSAAGGEPVWVTGSGSKIKHPSQARTAAVVSFEDWLFEINIWRHPLGSLDVETAAPVAVISSTQWDFAPEPSPRGDRVAYLSSRSGGHAIWIQSIDGHDQNARPVTGEDLQVISPPRWSPDGERLVFTAVSDGRQDVYSISPDELVPRRLTDDASAEIAPSWSSDGRSVFFGAHRDGEWRVWRLDLDSNEREPISPPGGYAARQAPDGTIYYVRIDQSGLWRQQGIDGEPIRVASDLEPHHWLDWTVSRSGVHYVAHTDARRSDDILLRFVAHGETSPVTLGPLGELGRPGISISHDEASLFYSSVDRAECDVLILENA